MSGTKVSARGNELVTALKHAGEATADDLAGALGLSHASVKRLFAERSFSLIRVEAICQFLGMDMIDMMRQAELDAERLHQLTLAQETELVRDAKLLCVAHSLLNKWRFEEVISTYNISEHEGIVLMARLDRMKLIEMLPGNRYRLLVSRKFQWIPGGPIQAFFEQQLQADYFDSSFNKENEIRVFISAMLSTDSVHSTIKQIRKLADEVNEMHLNDEKLPLSKRRGISIVLASRPWEIRVFQSLRRTQPS